MAEVITMPRMSDTMIEGNIVGWRKKEGDSVEVGELLAEIETDKATMDFDSPADGVLLHIAIKEGSVPIDAVIAVIGEAGEDWKSAIASKGTVSDTTPDSAPESSSPAAAIQVVASSNSDTEARIKASPLAKSIAKEAGIDLTAVKGSGDHGRIVKKDLEAMISAPAPAVTIPVSVPKAIVETPAPKPAPEKAVEPAIVPFTFSGVGNNYEDVAVSQMRKTIARRLGESKFSAPHFYLTIEIDMDKATQLRKQLNEVAPVKLSFNDLVIKAASVTLKQHPAINSSWMGDHLRINKDVNIGVAVAVEEGLLVPVIRYADIKTLSQINTEVKELAGKAKNRKLQPQEMQGNTFTISNLGMFGIEEFTAIINPPDACILAVGSIIEKPVVKDGNIVIGQRMKVTLSCDHRVVDGAKGAAFLQTFKQILEDPIRLLV
ncbi:MAG: pyruvate dehydrogenase complex dihydrolipoamide acetyltransferase [Saprospiraceae bacterium]|nr:pyruvate dehydrogenase complex dihydrolipoamide acetyltransferase [Saprospiraceae bacterium]